MFFPAVPETLGAFNVLSHRNRYDIPVGGQREWSRLYELESLQGGDFQIPPLAVSVDGQTLRSQSITVSVVSAVEANSDPFAFRDIKPQVDIPPPEELAGKWPPLVLAGILVVALTAGAVVLMVRRQRSPLSAGKWALLELERLQSSPSTNDTPQHAVEMVPAISEVLREYMERQFEILATRQTTEEFLKKSQHDPRLSEQQRSLLKRFLTHVDEVKFAHRQPEQGRLHDSYRLVQDFIRATSGDVD